MSLADYHNIFDSHAHYDDKRFATQDLDALFAKLRQNGVSEIINVGCDLASSKRSVAFAQTYDFFHAAVGIHPHHAAEASADYLSQLRAFCTEDQTRSHIVAIGEIGLDYHYDFSPRSVQRRIFAEQLQLAEELSLPVIIHAREATADLISLLQEHRPKGVVHCFSGSAQTATRCVELGLFLGFTGVVTFPNAKKVREAVSVTPLDRILLETDCPYMAPVPHRGKTCTSDLIAFTAEAIASCKGISPQACIDQATHNTKRLFFSTHPQNVHLDHHREATLS